MTRGQRLKALGVTAACTGLAMAGMLFSSPRGKADDNGDNSESRIEKGFEIAPVPLNLEGKNRALVGLGSYIVNGQGDCNACHSAGPTTEFVRGGNPYFGQPKKINPATYMGGGRVFPPFDVKMLSAPIISRNLTPSTKTALPEGDHTFEDFLTIMRTGKDFDHLHPTCPPGVLNTSCVPPPFDGDLLQVMRWPNFQEMTDHDIRAIYEYLKAIPCIQGNYPGPGGAGIIPPESADRCKP